jgi:hypothetical protein
MGQGTMTGLLWIAAWYASGVAGTIIYIKANQMDRVDARTGLMVFPLFGPFILLMGLVAALGALVSAIYFYFEEL